MNSINANHLQPELTKLGLRLRHLRNQQGWTLGALAEHTGISEAYLSRLESGERQPSLAVLFSLAKAHNIAVSSLFESERTGKPCVVVRAGSVPMQAGQGVSFTSLSSGNHFTNLQPIRAIVPTNRQGDCLYQHEGEEWLYVLSGQLLLTIGNEEYLLQVGDAAHFDAQTPHRLLAQGEFDAEIILVACAPPSPLLGSYLKKPVKCWI